MASRWAYEALAVTQFKNNEYEKVFFEYDKDMSFANWKKDQWISNLQSKLKDIKRQTDNSSEIKTEEQTMAINRNMFIVKNEIEKEIRNVPNISYEDIDGLKEAIDSISVNKFSVNTYNSIQNYLSVVKERYKIIYKNNEFKKDSLQQKHIKPNSKFIAIIDAKKDAKEITQKEHRKLKKIASKIKNENFKKFRNKYKNKALEDFVTNSNTLIFTDEDNSNIIQKSDPIYLDPYDFDYFKSHFYAPRKKIFGFYMDTFVANLIVIWLMTIFLVVTLYYDVLKWMVNSSSKFSSIFKLFKAKKAAKK